MSSVRIGPPQPFDTMRTSYFAKNGSHHAAVSIACSNPRGFKGKHYPKLAPPYWLVKKLKEDGDTKYYTEHYYKEVLDKLDPLTVYRELQKLATDEAILLCWEKDNGFCHRHLVADWLNKNECDMDITEMT